jgi:hypothetical protein
MKVRNISFALSTALAACSALGGVAACSSSTTPETTTTTDASTSSVDGSKGTGTDSGGNPGTDAGTDPGTDSGGSTCATPPALFEPTDAGLYCPYDYGPDGGGAAHCKVGTQICCLSPSTDAGSSVCSASSATPTCAAAGFQVWQCSSPAECAGNANGTTCCLTAGPVEADPNCSGFQKTKGFDSTTCTTPAKCTGTVTVGAFTDDLTVVCEKQSDCATGTCTPIKTSGTAIGACL